MDFIALLVGIIIGAVAGFIIAWIWASSVAKAKHSAAHSTEAELKALLAQQAKTYLETSRETIQSVERELASLRDSVNDYENTLTMQNEDDSKTSYFGEHAGVFLRNTDEKATKHLISENSNNQPRDFANNGSGLFVGTSASESQNKKKKSTN